MKRVCFFAFCIIVSFGLLIATLLHPAGQPNTLQSAIEKAIGYLKDSREPYALLWLDVMHRRFGISEFADALQRYDQELAAHPEQAPLLRVFRRIADYNNPLQTEDLNVVFGFDRITVPALYCDRLGLPANYSAILIEAANSGGYWLTHVLLACIWVKENDCEVPLPEGFLEGIYNAAASLIGNDPVIDDLELEAAALLFLAGQGILVKDAFIEQVIAAQNDDGGWSLYHDGTNDSHWHPTMLALLILLHVKYPSDSYPPMLDPASH